MRNNVCKLKRPPRLSDSVVDDADVATRSETLAETTERRSEGQRKWQLCTRGDITYILVRRHVLRGLHRPPTHQHISLAACSRGHDEWFRVTCTGRIHPP